MTNTAQNNQELSSGRAEPPATRPSSDVSTLLSNPWGAAEETDVSDILLPKIRLIQPTSKNVPPGANPGDFRNSLSGDFLGNNEKPLHVVIFGAFKTWTVMKDDEYAFTESFTEQNQNQEINVFEDGVQISRYVTRSFYCLVAGVKDDIPFVFSLRSSATGAAKVLHTAFAQLAREKLPSAAKVFRVTVERKEKKGVFFVPVIATVADTKPEILARAYRWYQDLRRLKDRVRVDDSDLRDPNEEPKERKTEAAFDNEVSHPAETEIQF